MKLNKTLWWCAFLCIPPISAQEYENQQVKDWVVNNPHVKFVGTKDRNLYNEAEWSELLSKENVFIYEGSVIEWAEVLAFQNSLLQKQEEKWIREWVKNHPDVKMISQEYFNSLSDEKKAIYLEAHVLIIEGTMPSKSEISNYETE